MADPPPPLTCLSLWQPWASAVASGRKRIETRAYHTAVRGPLAIHATRHIPREVSLLWEEDANLRRAAGFARLTDLPLGCIVAVAELAWCEEMMNFFNVNGQLRVPIRPVPDGEGAADLAAPQAWLTEQEYRLGHWEKGRYAWYLPNICPLPSPVPAKGSQGFWKASTDVCRAVWEQLEEGAVHAQSA